MNTIEIETIFLAASVFCMMESGRQILTLTVLSITSRPLSQHVSRPRRTSREGERADTCRAANIRRHAAPLHIGQRARCSERVAVKGTYGRLVLSVSLCARSASVRSGSLFHKAAALQFLQKVYLDFRVSRG
ncbi:hypothetical protein SKAU_G00111460 [Synaphobranchus kaupii]|uniref:Uncharacterized protein n=1 Tax=Synaphobranchus kaupii TaxID=118154 RepID=A0A9Q1J8H2_SYNKA|nr:hypothetical protein SKAU_G00111460 [Synaphobranchus kaupii]